MNRNFFRLLPRKSVLALTVAGLGMLTLTGCGMGTATVGNPQGNAIGSGRAISGISHGGINPVIGQTVTLWSTLSNNAGTAGYPSSSNTAVSNVCPLSSAGASCSSTTYTSAQLAQTTTLGDGSFAFTAGSYTCPAGQFVYITGTGGNTGSNTANNQSVMMAALGSCSHFDNATDEGNIHIMLGEDTTVAAAYALGNFMYVNDNGAAGTQLVFVSAPPNNNATTGACTGTGTSMTCTAAGLSHAFANAANLVNAVSYTSGYPTGTPYNNPPSNPTFGTVPVALINTLGNIVQACTNTQSTGSTPSTACSTLFTDAAPSSSSNNVTTAPLDTLQAVIAIAKSPQHNVTTIYGLATPNSFFQPALSAAPHDFSIGITYAPVVYDSANTSQTAIPITAYSISGSAVTFTAANSLKAGEQVYVTGFPTSTALNGLTYSVSSPTGTSFIGTPPIATTFTLTGATESASAYLDNPLHVSLDANDNVYVTSQDGATETEGGLSALSSNGTPNWNSTLSTNYCQPQMSAPDTNGNVWMSSDQISTGCGSSGNYLIGYNASTGALSSATITAAQISQTFALATDRFNNVWTVKYSGSCGTSNTCIYEFPYNSGTNTYTKTGQSNVLETALNDVGFITIDADENIYLATNIGYGTTASYVSVYQNTGTTSAPVYANATSSFHSVALADGGYGAVALDANNNIWSSSSSASTSGTYYLEKTPVTYSGATASLGSVVNETDSSSHPGQGFFDGLGTYWYPNITSSGELYYYVPSTSSNKGIVPCYIPVSATGTACSTFFSAYDPRVVVLDSTGSVWVVSALAGEVTQIIGAAEPTWPQLSYAVFGSLPQ